MKKMLAATAILTTIVLVSAFSFMHQNPEIKSRASLGKKLFSEKILSKDSSVSCASCHKPGFAFADSAAFSPGIYGRLTKRNTPSVLNMKNRPYYFWDGRATTLQDQSLMPIENPDEMGMTIDEAVQRLRQSQEYKKLFARIFGQLPDKKNLAEAIAAYENTLETNDSRFDDWANDLGKLTKEEERGRQLFIGEKAKCFSCHSMEDFTDDRFKNIGLYNGKELADAGLFNITKKEEDKGKFKTPGLRNVAVTAPYMHNGRFRTLEQVVSYYNTPFMFVDDPLNIDTLLKKPLGLSQQEKKDLVSFLKTLTDKAYMKRQG